MLRSGTIVLGGKLLQLATAATVALLLPRLMAEADLGVFFLAQVAIATGAAIAQYGLTFTVPASVGEALTRRDDATAGAVCRTALLLCLAMSAVVCVPGWLLAGWTGAPLRASFGGSGSAGPIVLAAIPLAALAAVLAEMHRVSRGMALASLLPNAQGAAGAGLALVAVALAWRLDAAGVLVAGVIGLAAAVGTAIAVLQRRLDLRAASADPAARLAGLAVLAWPALLTSVGATVVSLADQAVVGAVGGPVDAAHYGLGVRVSSLLSLPLAIVNMTIVPHIVAHWTAGRRRRLQWLLTTSASAAAAGAILGLAGIAALFVIGPDTNLGTVLRAGRHRRRHPRPRPGPAHLRRIERLPADAPRPPEGLHARLAAHRGDRHRRDPLGDGRVGHRRRRHGHGGGHRRPDHPQRPAGAPAAGARRPAAGHQPVPLATAGVGVIAPRQRAPRPRGRRRPAGRGTRGYNGAVDPSGRHAARSLRSP